MVANRCLVVVAQKPVDRCLVVVAQKSVDRCLVVRRVLHRCSGHRRGLHLLPRR